ncbi:MAG: hypothetical protein Kow0097_09530 [Candidatus Bipolaricaulota bacterium]
MLVVLLLGGSSIHTLAPAGGAGATGLPQLIGSALPWGLERIHAPQAWQVTTGSPEVTVAVIDSGIDWTIPELAAVRWTNPREIPGNGIDDDGNGYVDDAVGWDFRDGVAADHRRTPLHWHGTFVAGIIAARLEEGRATGVAPNVRIMDVRFLDSRGLFTTKDWDRLAAAIRYAVDSGARIINLSLYAKGTPPAVVEEALAYATSRGAIVVGIAGNEARAEVLYPGRYSTVLAVSATDAADALASFSSWGPEVAVAAPGHEVVSLLPGGRLATNSGTSFAAPHVSGTLALILSANPALSADEAVRILLATSSPLAPTPDPRFGAGLVNAGRGVAAAAGIDR